MSDLIILLIYSAGVFIGSIILLKQPDDDGRIYMGVCLLIWPVMLPLSLACFIFIMLPHFIAVRIIEGKWPK